MVPCSMSCHSLSLSTYVVCSIVVSITCSTYLYLYPSLSLHSSSTYNYTECVWNGMEEGLEERDNDWNHDMNSDPIPFVL